MYNGKERKYVIVKFEEIEFIGIKPVKAKYNQQNQYAYGHQ